MSARSLRARNAIRAAEVLAQAAPAVAARCRDALPGEVVVAEVAADLRFAGVRSLPRHALHASLARSSPGAWVVTFARHTSLEEIERRCFNLGRTAYRRWKLSARLDRRSATS